MIWLEANWPNLLRVIFTAFFAGFAWSAGAWLFAQFVGAAGKLKR